jgi:hypothetical protein
MSTDPITKEPIETREQKEERFKLRAKKMSTLTFLRPLEKAAEVTNQRMVNYHAPQGRGFLDQ